jgi:hypothetical protein
LSGALGNSTSRCSCGVVRRDLCLSVGSSLSDGCEQPVGLPDRPRMAG